MTWGEWVASEYNTINLAVDDIGRVCCENVSRVAGGTYKFVATYDTVNTTSMILVMSDDLIIENNNYFYYEDSGT